MKYLISLILLYVEHLVRLMVGMNEIYGLTRCAINWTSGLTDAAANNGLGLTNVFNKWIVMV
jgi:hypothetical protein